MEKIIKGQPFSHFIRNCGYFDHFDQKHKQSHKIQPNSKDKFRLGMWYMSVTLVLRRLKQKDHNEFQAILGYRMTPKERKGGTKGKEGGRGEKRKERGRKEKGRLLEELELFSSVLMNSLWLK